MSQRLCNILEVCASYNIIKTVQAVGGILAVVGSVVVDGALTSYALLHLCDLKATQMNKQWNLIWEN